MAGQLGASRSQSLEATIIVKALPQVGEKHGETVCVAAFDDDRRWYRLYPVAFRSLQADQRFTRWSRVRAACRLVAPNRDRRAESRNIDQSTIKLPGKVEGDRRSALLEPALVDSTKRELAEGRSLALIRPKDPTFYYKKRSQAELNERLEAYARLAAQPDIFGTEPLAPLTPAPFEFGYRYFDADGAHDCRCHDWEVEQTFVNWERKYGRELALSYMVKQYGETYPSEGMAFAMGTHSAYPSVWMIIGVIKLRPTKQATLL